MSEIGADFGITLAYIVPGFLSLWSVAYLHSAITNLFRSAVEGEQRALAVFSLAVICLAIGMFLSMIRAGTIDQSFRLALPTLLCEVTDPKACDVKRGVDPDFRALTCNGIRESFLLAESRFKRPYQFYGDMVLVLIVAGASFAWRFRISAHRVGGYRVTFLVVLWAIGVFAFYSAERLAHYRYTVAVEKLNERTCESTKNTAQLNVLKLYAEEVKN